MSGGRDVGRRIKKKQKTGGETYAILSYVVLKCIETKYHRLCRHINTTS